MRRILTIGFELASPDAHHASIRSKTSLLDWDIILFKPEIDKLLSSSESYQGKPSLSDGGSFRLKDCCEHWRRELKQAFDAGKTVLIYLPELKEVFVDTGQRSYSGTGRNQKTTHHVAKYDNYRAIPADLGPLSTIGKAMKLSPKGAELLSGYWSEFESVSEYKVLLTGNKVSGCVLTRTGEKPVGALFHSNSSAGSLLLLPDINFFPANFTKYRGDKENWTAAAEQFAARLIAVVVALDKAFRSTGEITPEPSWASESEFSLAAESLLRVQLLKAERDVETAQKNKERLEEELRSAGTFRSLLFEKGKPLEKAVIGALRLLGFTAAPFKESDSEFDVVFEASEGRLIGEAEGKDNKAVNIDKLRQLAMNIHEDLQRDSVTTPAKPVLFGNGYRLQALPERPDPFTEKCASAASTSSTALVFTPDLFPPIRYLLENPDEEYAAACRQAIVSSTGRAVFPSPPAMQQPEETQVGNPAPNNSQ